MNAIGVLSAFLRQNLFMKVRTSSIRVTIWIILIWLFAWHIVLWRGQAWVGLQLVTKTSLGFANDSDWFQMGHLCRQLKRFNCAIDAYSEVLNRYPDNTAALGFVAMSQVELGQCGQAEPFFDRYFNAAGDDGEAWYYWGRCRDGEGDVTGARAAYYRAAQRNPHNEVIVDQLVDFLGREGRFEEALSALASVTEGEPYKSEVYRHRYLSLERQLKSPQGKKRAIRLPGLKSINFYSPMRLSSDSELEFYILAPEEKTVKVYAPVLSRLSPSGSKSVLDQVQVGPWVIDDVQVEPYPDRIGRLGQSVLDRFEVYEEVEAGVRFLVIYAH